MKKILRYLCLLVLLSFYVVLLLRSQDADMYFLISTGRKLIDNISYIRTNIYQQWLYCVIIAYFDRLGYIGHIGFVFLQNVLFVIIAAAVLNLHLKNKQKSYFYAFLILLVSCSYMINIRPQIITAILMMAHYYCLAKAEEDDLWWLGVFISIILEANLHGSVVLYHLIIPLFVNRREFILNSVFVCIASLINPYSYQILIYTASALTNNVFDYVQILELQPMNLFSMYAIPVVIGVALSIYCIYKRTFKFADYVAALLLFLPFQSYRHLTLLPIALIVLVPTFLKTISIEIRLSNKEILLFSSALCLIFACTLFLMRPRDLRDVERASNPIALVEMIPADARLYTEFNNGAYLAYNGREHIFIDARPELYFDKLNDYKIFTTGYDTKTNTMMSFSQIDNLIKQYHFDYIVSHKSSIISYVCEASDHYVLIGEDQFNRLYEVCN